MDRSPASDALENYFRAKDGNRPHLLRFTFTPDATLEIRNRSSAISFPALTQGREAIADVLVRQFGQANDNVYLQRPEGAPASFTCQWLVVMTEKVSGNVRVGGGTYDWTFGSPSNGLASRLVIDIATMFVLPAASQEMVLGWACGLPYPWATLEAMRTSAPSLPEVDAVLHELASA